MNLYSSIFNETFIYPNESRPLLYTSAFCKILLDYSNKSLNVLEKMENIYHHLEASGYNISFNICNLKKIILENMNNTNLIFEKSLDISSNISNLFKKVLNNSLMKSIIVEKTRKLITTFEISLKYFPQIYFEILKNLHHQWYIYESKI
jgi:hypothetical protein